MFCCDKHAFAVTKTILVAAPTNDGGGGGGGGGRGGFAEKECGLHSFRFYSLTHELFGIFGS